MKKLLPLILVLCLLFVACAPAASGGSTSSHIPDTSVTSSMDDTETTPSSHMPDASVTSSMDDTETTPKGFWSSYRQDQRLGYFYYNDSLISCLPTGSTRMETIDGKLFAFNFKMGELYRWDSPEEEVVLVASLNTRLQGFTSPTVHGALGPTGYETIIRVSPCIEYTDTSWKGAVLTHRGNLYWFDGSEFQYLTTLEDDLKDVFIVQAFQDYGVEPRVRIFVDTEETDRLWENMEISDQWQMDLWQSRKKYNVMVSTGETVPMSEQENERIYEQFGIYVQE